MKFIKEQPAGDGHARYYFALGKQEAVILRGLLLKALENMPKLFETQSLELRMKDMQREIFDALPEMEDQTDTPRKMNQLVYGNSKAKKGN